ncbi:MAG: hypothetical protein J5927_03275, partial [Oscillospiraceae bacterium]|nr:hypothetical protein [Oscillospiraceae bacterium]
MKKLLAVLLLFCLVATGAVGYLAYPHKGSPAVAPAPVTAAPAEPETAPAAPDTTPTEPETA